MWWRSSSGNKPGGAVMALLSWILLAQIGSSTAGLPLSSFVRFGELVDERINHTHGWSPVISDPTHLDVSFRFYGFDASQVYVHASGYLFFKISLHDTDFNSVVVPFGSNVNLALGGAVWYRQTRGPEELHQITSDIRSGTGFAFTATWAFIATWDNVTFIGANSIGAQLRNTFQLVLAFEESTSTSYAILNYNTLVWTSGLDPTTGRGQGASAGFYDDITGNYYFLPGSQTENITELAVTSNVGVPGKWVFKISGENITDQMRFCPDGWLFDTASQKCLKWFSELITKDEMLPKCQEHDALPVNIQKRATHFFLRKISHGHIWLDLYKLEGTWFWGTEPYALGWTNWSNRERQVGGCVLMEARPRRKWRVVNCDNWRATYICSRPRLNNGP